MRGAGALVLTPAMPWSRNRIYAKSYEDSMQEVHSAVLQLKKDGAEAVFVAGHSMGANAVLGYAARGYQFDGLILFAPGHVPGKPGYAEKVSSSTPVFCVDGSRDRYPHCNHVLSHLAADVPAESVTVNAGHRDVPNNAATEAVEWVRKRVLN